METSRTSNAFDNEKYLQEQSAAIAERIRLRRLGVNLTCDPRFATEKLFVS